MKPIEKDFSCVEALWFDENFAHKDGYNFQLNVEGDMHVFTEGNAFSYSSESLYTGSGTIDYGRAAGGKKDVTVNRTERGLQVIQHYEFFEGCCAVRQYNTVKNQGENPLPLIRVSSAYLNIEADTGVMAWDDPRRFRLHWCKSAWAAEAQWKHGSFWDFGMAPARPVGNSMTGVAAFRSEGSWSSGRYYPLVIVEDLEKGCSYFMEHEGGHTWELTVGKLGDTVTLECNSADINHDGWSVTLAPGEEYTTTCAVYGMVQGGFEEAVRELTEYKRQTSHVGWKNGTAPVCFNCYMDCIFGEPNVETLVPLIEAAAKAGCEVFCIDAGWFRPRNNANCLADCGDYIPDAERFGPGGLKGILDLIRQKGMIPGLWFELEAVDDYTAGAKCSSNAMVRRNGTVLSGGRGIYDLCDETVRQHLFAAVDRAYQLGMRYIKNDHNFSTGIGYGERGDCYNTESRKRMDAFYSFIMELYRRYPDLIIENCGSGAMRADHGTLSHFYLQSTSDQEYYFNYASIAAGSLAIMPPEKAGNWVYPYAVTVPEAKELDAGGDASFLIQRNQDGEETIFNLVTGNIGTVYMAGRIEYADAYNFKLIQEGVELFKKNRAFIASSSAVYPLGAACMGKRGFIAAGLMNRERTEMLLAVWKIRCIEEDCCMIELGRYFSGATHAEMIFPQKDTKCRYTYAPEAGRLTVKMEGSENMARLFRIRLSERN